MSYDMPVINLRIDRMAETIQHAMMVHSDEVNVMVAQSVAEHMKPENIQAGMHKAIGQAIQGAVEGISTHYEVKQAAAKLVAACLERSAQEVSGD